MILTTTDVVYLKILVANLPDFKMYKMYKDRIKKNMRGTDL